VTEEPRIATHAEPAWRDKTNYIVQLDLAEYDLPGRFEQCWTRTEDEQLFELCCIPFFPYGYSLGDVLHVDPESGRHSLVRKGGHQTIRFIFKDDQQAHEQHDRLHRALVEDAGCLVELRQGGHYGTVDIDDPSKAGSVVAILTPHFDAGYLTWEWADPPLGE
jgi:hypothetical protein